MPVSGAIVEKPAEKGRKTWIKFKLSIFFLNDGHGATSAGPGIATAAAIEDDLQPLRIEADFSRVAADEE